MRAITRVPEPPVAPMTNGGEWVTPTLATAKPDEQYPVLPQFSECRLFDVKKDPPETEDLIGREEYGNLIAELESKLFDQRAQTQDV